jgi:hypothetical protein
MCRIYRNNLDYKSQGKETKRLTKSNIYILENEELWNLILEDKLARDSLTTSSLYFLKMREAASTRESASVRESASMSESASMKETTSRPQGVKRKWDETFLMLPSSISSSSTTTSTTTTLSSPSPSSYSFKTLTNINSNSPSTSPPRYINKKLFNGLFKLKNFKECSINTTSISWCFSHHFDGERWDVRKFFV